jgi:cholesterol transport system auxiliary component
MFALLLVVALSSGCGNPPARHDAAARFDFGPPDQQAAGNALVTSVDVAAPSWLAGDAMQYRLLTADPAWRREYADSRWAAPPAELLRRSLERRLVGTGKGRCRLRIELDEFIQEFESPTDSRMALAGRASLLAGADNVATRGFAWQAPAPSPDARGGVAAAAAATKRLGDELAAWIAAIDQCRTEGS